MHPALQIAQVRAEQNANGATESKWEGRDNRTLALTTRLRNMMQRQRDQNRVYPPDYVSAETLAYRLDCSRATIDAYVREGQLPKPELIGNLVRWDFADVRTFIKARNVDGAALDNGALHDPADPYLKALKYGTPSQE
jgi:predicted DNA-binding transcriptional regulator AlpA